MIATVTARRYVTPLRQGGSLPALIEADDGQLYVTKLAGSGHGRKALIAELLAGEIARALGLRVPELAFIALDPALCAGEPNPEIRDLLGASVGLNLGLRFLPSALEYDPAAMPPPAPEEASAIVWFDAYVTNVDRTPRNVNLLLHDGRLWLIDHGASLYFHYTSGWHRHLESSRSPFGQVRDHVLLPAVQGMDEADARLKLRLSEAVIEETVDLIPASWLEQWDSDREARRAYASWLTNRLHASDIFVREASDARTACV